MNETDERISKKLVRNMPVCPTCGTVHPVTQLVTASGTVVCESCCIPEDICQSCNDSFESLTLVDHAQGTCASEDSVANFIEILQNHGIYESY